jgi:hypothetical protein
MGIYIPSLCFLNIIVKEKNNMDILMNYDYAVSIVDSQGWDAF